ncbi:MAG: 50S ribosomal protein L25 [Bacteroidota bacterium]
MKSIELTAALRDNTGKRDTKAIRVAGKVPGVVYANSEATHITIDHKELERALYTAETYIVKLSVDGKVHDTIVRHADYHPVTEVIQHVEFLKVTDDKAVALTLPVNLTGTPVGVSKGGKLAIKLRKIKVKGVPAQLPDRIDVDVSGVELGGTVKVGNAGIEGMHVLTSPSAAIASVIIPRSLRSAQSSTTEEE